MTCNTIVIFFSKDRAMQLDAAIRSCRVHCKDLSSVKKYVIFKVSSEIHAKQYVQLQHENSDFFFMEETQVIPQILSIVSPFKFISFHCDDNMYIRDFSFFEAAQILLENELVLGHSFRLGRNITYSYTRSSPEPQPEFFELGQGVLRFNWAVMQPRGFGYPFEISASMYRCDQVLSLITKCPDYSIGKIETFLNRRRRNFINSFPFLTCEELSSIISVPVNRVGIISNRVGQNQNYSIENLAHKFTENFRISIGQFDDYTSEATHVELEFSFERKSDERME